MTDATVAATTDSTKSGEETQDQAANSQESGSSLADTVIATGTMIGGVGTTVLAGVSAIPVVKDAVKATPGAAKGVVKAAKGAASGMRKLFGKTEDALEDVAGDAKDLIGDALGALRLSEGTVQTALGDILKLGKDAGTADIVPIIANAVQKEGPAVAKTVSEGAIKAAAEAIEVAVKVI